MKLMIFMSMAMIASCARAWDSVSEMERDFCLALTNKDYLLSATFTNQLACATNLTSVDSRCEVFMLSSVHAAQCFEKTVDEFWLQEEMRQASNAVVVIGTHSNKWQYWMSRLVYAGACASQSNYEQSLWIMTNSLAEIASSGFANEVSSVGRLLLKKHEMPDVSVCDAMKVMAGMSAAVTGRGVMATNYARQVSAPYKNTILEFVK